MTTERRDMTERQFVAALKKHGFGNIGTFGYVPLPKPVSNVHVSIHNGGGTLRSKLAYLLQSFKDELTRRGIEQ